MPIKPNYKGIKLEYICFHTGRIVFGPIQKETTMIDQSKATRSANRDQTIWPDSTPDFLQLRDRAKHQRTLAINAALSAIWGRLTGM